MRPVDWNKAEIDGVLYIPCRLKVIGSEQVMIETMYGVRAWIKHDELKQESKEN